MMRTLACALLLLAAGAGAAGAVAKPELPKGLAAAQVEPNRTLYGANVIPRKSPKAFLEHLWEVRATSAKTAYSGTCGELRRKKIRALA